jgi:hypothetical protein
MTRRDPATTTAPLVIWFIWAMIWLALVIGTFAVAVHFILKWW